MAETSEIAPEATPPREPSFHEKLLEALNAADLEKSRVLIEEQPQDERNHELTFLLENADAFIIDNVPPTAIALLYEFNAAYTPSSGMFAGIGTANIRSALPKDYDTFLSMVKNHDTPENFTKLLDKSLSILAKNYESDQTNDKRTDPKFKKDTALLVENGADPKPAILSLIKKGKMLDFAEGLLNDFGGKFHLTHATIIEGKNTWGALSDSQTK